MKMTVMPPIPRECLNTLRNLKIYLKNDRNDLET